MIGKHCGKNLQRLSDNRAYFRRRCAVCGTVFKQRKRQPALPVHRGLANEVV